MPLRLCCNASWPSRGGDDDIAAALGAVLHRLRRRAVDEELQWLIRSGELSEPPRRGEMS